MACSSEEFPARCKNRRYHEHRNRDGSERKRSRQRVIRLDGKKKPDNIAYAFRDDWRDFRDGWELLDGDE